MAQDVVNTEDGTGSGNQLQGRITVLTGGRGSNLVKIYDCEGHKITPITGLDTKYDAKYDDSRYYVGDITPPCACYKLNETSGNALDSIGSLDLTLNGTITSGIGKIDGARDFDGVFDSKFNGTPIPATCHRIQNTGGTFTCWFNADTIGLLAGGFNNGICGIADSSTGEWWISLGENGSADIELTFFVAATGGTVTIDSTELIGLGTGSWFWVAVWVDLVSKKVHLSINDSVSKNATYTGTPNSGGAGDFELGAYNNGHHWDGLLDEAVFYDVILTAEEQTHIYNSGNGRSVCSSGCLECPPEEF